MNEISDDYNIIDYNIKESTIVDKKSPIDYDFIKDSWKKECPNLSSPRILNTARKKAIKNTLHDNHATCDDMVKVFKIISVSKWCNGDNSRQWKANFDWVIKDTHSCFSRLLEGEFTKSASEKKIYENIMADKNYENKDNNPNFSDIDRPNGYVNNKGQIWSTQLQKWLK
jgi:hypothetical protein